MKLTVYRSVFWQCVICAGLIGGGVMAALFTASHNYHMGFAGSMVVMIASMSALIQLARASGLHTGAGEC